jgi:two-component system response regulator
MAKVLAVLLVEDNPDDEHLSLRELRKLGLNAEVSRDGQQALERLTGGGDLPDLVLLDLRLPKIGGVELLRRLRANEETAGLRIIALAAPDEPDDIRSTYGHLADGFLQKPVSKDALAAMVSQLGFVSLNTSVL